MTEKLVIEGGFRLSGDVTISGAKNSVLKLMAAALLNEQYTRIENVPDLTDVAVMTDVVNALGRRAERSGSAIEIHEGSVSTHEAPYELVSKMRASFNVLGALIGRYGQARVPLPGGCSIGKRGVDQHVKGLKALGADVVIDHGCVEAKATQLTGAKIVLDMPSVGATENILLASAFAEGTTILANAAMEPEITDLANFLIAMGVQIEGAGSHEILIHGAKPNELKPVHYSVMPDRIEAATYMACSVATKGDVTLHKMRPDHLDVVIDKLQAMGAQVDLIAPDSLRIQGPEGRCEHQQIMTTYYPGFPTDLQAPFMSLLTTGNGVSTITETIYENRFKHVGELKRMGADIQVQGDVAVVSGIDQLSGAPVKAHDLRAGAAMVVAGLQADGNTSIFNLSHLDRGYEQLQEKLSGLGARIQRVPLDEHESKRVAEIFVKEDRASMTEPSTATAANTKIRRWYDHDPVLIEVLDLLRNFQEDVRVQAEEFIEKIEASVGKETLDNFYEQSKPAKFGNRWYDKDPSISKAVELLRVVPPESQRQAAMKFFRRYEKNADSLLK